MIHKLGQILNAVLSSPQLHTLSIGTASLGAAILALSEWAPKIGANLTGEEISNFRLYGLSILLVLYLSLSGILVLYELKNRHTSSNPHKFTETLNVALNAIRTRQYVSSVSIGQLKTVFDSNKLYLDPHTEQLVKNIIEQLWNVQTFNSELEDQKNSETAKKEISSKILRSYSALDAYEKEIEQRIRKIHMSIQSSP